MKNLLTRSVTGLVYVVTVLACIFLGKYSFALLGLLFISIGLFEFYKIQHNKGQHPIIYPSIITGLLIFLGFFFYSIKLLDPKYFILLIIPILLLFIIELYRKNEGPFENIAVSILGLAYIALPVSLLSLLVIPKGDGVYNPYPLLMVFILIWCFDTGAYLSGVAFGKHKLFPRISPKKSWEGVVGGIILTIIAALVYSHFYKPVDNTGMVIAAILAAVGATFGDLAESMLKRSADIKDSGKLLPGHGGLLDRIDSLLFVGPVIYIFLTLYN